MPLESSSQVAEWLAFEFENWEIVKYTNFFFVVVVNCQFYIVSVGKLSTVGIFL